MTTTVATARYTQASDFLGIANYQAIMDLCSKEPDCIPVEPFPLTPSNCADLLARMDAEGVPDEDWGYYVYAACVDMMSGSSFIWDTRKGSVPKTGSSQTVPHTEYRLGQLGLTKALVESQIPKGEAVQIQNAFFSGSRCQEVINLLKQHFGTGWNFNVKLVPAKYEWSRTEYEVDVRSTVADMHMVSFRVFGQGVVCPYNGHDSSWLKGYEPDKLCNVVDHHHRDRVRRGQRLSDGEFWQY